MGSGQKRSASPASDDYDSSEKWTTVAEAESKPSLAILQAGKDESKKEAGGSENMVEVVKEADSGEDDGNGNGSDGEEEEIARKGGFSDYFRIFRYADRTDRVLFSIAAICAIGSGAALPMMTLIFGRFTTKFTGFAVDQSDPGAFRRTSNTFAQLFVYLFLARFAVVYIGNVCVTIAALRTVRTIRKKFLESTLRQEVWHFDKEGAGSISTQVTTNGNRINQGVAEKLTSTLQALSLFISSFCVALSVQPKLALITMTIIPAILLVTSTCVAIDAKQESRIVRIYSQAGVLAQEALSSIKTVHAFWAQDKMAAKYDEFLADAMKHGKKKSPNFAIVLSVEYFMTLAGTALAFWEGFRMFQRGEITESGNILTVLLSVAVGASAIGAIAPQIQAISSAAAAASELFAVIEKESLLDPLSTEGTQPPSCAGQIEIRDLKFAYPSRPSAQILQGLNLSVPAGKTTALVGASGCGKSTLIAMLERWYEPKAGNILLDGSDLSEYNPKWLRSNIRLVQQEPVLFGGTIFQNVAKGLVESQDALPIEERKLLVVEACKSSNAHDFIMNLPRAYDTEVGERASMLSGGQRQRIAIARSIISNPKVLLLDEATSALDPKAESIVQDALNRVSMNKTTLVIAHKLATVVAADNIVVMSYGKVVEQGTHHELLQRDGQYAALVRAQDLGRAHGDEAVEEEDDMDFGAEAERILRARRLSVPRSRCYSRPQSRPSSHRWSMFVPGAPVMEDDPEPLTPGGGTLNLSLLRCIYIMLSEQRDLYGWFGLAIVACMIGGGTYPAQAVLFSRLINVFSLSGKEQEDAANFNALLLFVVAVANFFAYGAIGWVCNEVGQTVTRRYRSEMVQRILRLDQDFFDRPENSSGALTARLSSLPTALQELMSASLFLILIVVINVVASSSLAILSGWKLGAVVVFGGLPFLIGAGYTRIHLEEKFEKKAGENFADSAGLATEAVTSIRTVSSLTLESQLCQEYGAMLDGLVKAATRATFSHMILYALSQSLDFLIMALAFWYGSTLIAKGEYTIQQFFVIYIAVIFGGQAAGQFFGYTTSMTKARPAANYILWLRTLKTAISENSDNKRYGPPGCDGPIGVKNVEFNYTQRKARVLKGIDMHIQPGTYAACVGPSGCGKSTLISLLERFYDPTSGLISLGHRNITGMSPRLYRNYMSLVQQEPTLYQGSVRDNIALGLPYEPSDDEILEACRQANALEFIASLPQGLSTPCGSKGLQFSGGQRQRIAIARALIRKPRLLLLDEATSALDTQSERIVQKTLDEAASSRTTIAVAHRLSTIRHADVIFVFSEGRIVEKGTHAVLQKLRGVYYEMCLAQSLDK